MFGKVSRIFLKSIGIVLFSLLLIGIALFFAIQSYAFQTWLGKRVSSYLSTELQSQISIQQIKINFFKSAEFKKVFIADLTGDTLYNGDLDIHLKLFNWKLKKLYLSSLTLKQVNSKVIKYKQDKDFNYQFLVNYFSGDSIADQKKSDWEFKLGDIILNNVRFDYQDLNDTLQHPHQINFSNISLSNVNGTISGLIVEKDSVLFQLHQFQAKEKSGFTLTNLSTQAYLSNTRLTCNDLLLKTTKTRVSGHLNFYYKKWNDFNEFISNVTLNSTLDDSSVVCFSDIAYFAPVLYGLNQSVSISGNVKGSISDLSLQKFRFRYGQQTEFKGNLNISGLPDIANSYLHFDAKRLSCNYYDLIQLPAFPFSENKKLAIPIELEKLGTINYKGKFDGLIKDFTTYGEFKTALGVINSELSIQLGDHKDDISYAGNLSTENFYLGQLLGLKDFNALSMNLSLKGKGLSLNKINSEVKGSINNISFQNYQYKKIKINGTLNEKIFNGLFSCLDTNANFDFNGSVDFKNKVPEMYFISTINRLNLNKLHLTNIVDSGEFSSQIFININGDNLNNLSGQINFDNSVYKTKTKSYKLNSLNLDLQQSTSIKSILLKSAYFNASIDGQFNIDNLPLAFENLLNYYFPSYFEKPKSKKQLSEEFKFKIDVKNFETIHDLFLPELMISKGSYINGEFNSNLQKIKLQFYSNQLNYNVIKLNKLALTIQDNKQSILSELKSQSLQIGDSVSLENPIVNLNSTDQVSSYLAHWDNQKSPRSNGSIGGIINFEKLMTRVKTDSLLICVNDSIWKIENPSQFVLNDKTIAFDPFKISNHAQSLIISGVLSENPSDSLQIKAANINLSQFNPLLRMFNLKTEGELNGFVYISKPNNNLAIDGNVNLLHLKVNDNLVGELSIKSTYHTANKYLNVAGYTSLGLQDEFGNQIKNIAFNGNYYLDNRKESIDILLKANPANIKLINPFLEGILSIKNGYVNGDVKIHGSPDDLKLDGKLRLFNCEMKIDYTNVSYNMSGDIEIMPDQIRFSDVLMREKGTKAAAQGTVNGNIFHDHFKKIQLDYDISYKNMLVLNTSEKENKTFYGKIYSTGNAGIYGYLNNLNMQIIDTITKNSKFIMPLDGPSEIEDDDFVHFVKRDTIKEKVTSFGGFNLDLSIIATPVASVQIILDKQNGDMLNAQGQGNINLKINTLGKFEMLGEYIITNGDYLFTLEHVINKKFDIEAGSSISWNGSPLNADINVATSYKQRASVAPLLNDTTGAYKSRYAVDCKLLLSGKLFSPNINFAFDFPNVDATAKARIYNVLSDEAELNRQVFSFLLFRNFVTPQIFNSNGGGVTAGSAAASTSSELLSNRISGFINSYFGGLTGLKDLQLGLNYRPGNQNSKESVDLALSKQFLNNKISVDGNFGMNNNQTSHSGNFIGDVNIDYKLTDDGRYRLTGFNRTNNSAQITTAGGPYTQGVGFFYRREYNSFKDFLNRNKSTNQKK